MLIKALIIIITIHSTTCLRLRPTEGWKSRLYITWRPRYAYHTVNDFMGNSEKRFISNTTFELVRDARLKMRQTAGVRKQHETYVGYHVGLIVGKIREKYRNMLDTYREGQDHRHDRLLMKPPGIHDDRIEHYFLFFELIRRYELHIDHLVNVIEGIPEEDWAGNQGMLDQRIYSTFRPYGRRHNKQDQFTYDKSVIDEQKLKQNLRQKFLMKKLGRPENTSTSQKRFVNKWPVDETWREYFSGMY